MLTSAPMPPRSPDPLPALGPLAMLISIAALAVASFALHRTYATVREFREARDSAILRAVIAEEQHWLGEWREWTQASAEERRQNQSQGGSIHEQDPLR